MFHSDNEEDDTGCACGTYRGEEKCHRVLVGKYEEKGLLEYVCVAGRILLKCVLKKLYLMAWLSSGRSARLFGVGY